MTEISKTKTEVGNYFVANYPPFSQWLGEYIPKVVEVLEGAPRIEEPLGLYIHIPFCRKRCKFCYFKVYTDKNASEIMRLPPDAWRFTIQRSRRAIARIAPATVVGMSCSLQS